MEYPLLTLINEPAVRRPRRKTGQGEDPFLVGKNGEVRALPPLPCHHLLMANLVPIVLSSMGRKSLRRTVHKTSYHTASETISAECVSRG